MMLVSKYSEQAQYANPQRAPTLQWISELFVIVGLFFWFNWYRILSWISKSSNFDKTTDTVTIVIFVAFLVLWGTTIKSKWYEILRPWRPSGYITLGLLGTFFGIAFSLQQVDFTKRLADTELVNVLKAVSLAFDKSVIGVLASIIASIGNRFTSEQEEDSREKEALLSTINNLSKLPELVDHFNSFFRNIENNFSASLSGAFGQVVEQNKEVLDSFHKDLIYSLAQQAQVLKDESEHLTGLFNGIKETTQHLENVSDAIGDLETGAEKLKEASRRIAKAGTNLGKNADRVQQDTVDFLGTILSRIQTVQSQGNEIAQLISSNMEQSNILIKNSTKVPEAADSLSKSFQAIQNISTKIELSLGNLDGLDRKLEGIITGFLNNLNKQLNVNIASTFNEIVTESIERIKEVGKQQDRLSTEIYDSGVFIAASVSFMEEQFNKATENLVLAIKQFDGSLSGKLGQLEKIAVGMEKVQRRMEDVTDRWKDHRSDLVKTMTAFTNSSSSMSLAMEKFSEKIDMLGNIIENKFKQISGEMGECIDNMDIMVPDHDVPTGSDGADPTQQLSEQPNPPIMDPKMISSKILPATEIKRGLR